MLMRSMPSEYSPSRPRGITTSSFTLKALVWAAMAAVRERSSQNFLRASGVTATKPSPPRDRANSTILRGGGIGGGGVVAGQVGQQHHVGAADAVRLGGIAHGPDVARVHVLQAGQHHAAGAGVHQVLHLDDGGHRLAHRAEELHAHRADLGRHAVQHEGGLGDEAVAALLLDAGQAGQELVGDVLAQALLAEQAAGDGRGFPARPSACRRH
jgi:hypothetical protein